MFSFIILPDQGSPRKWWNRAKSEYVYVRECINCYRDVSFQAIAWIQAFMNLKVPHFYLFLACFGGF